MTAADGEGAAVGAAADQHVAASLTSSSSSSSSSKRSGTTLNNKIRQFEQVYDMIRHYGRYQFFMLLVIQYFMLNSVGNYIFISFATLRPTCKTNLRVVEDDACREIANCPRNATESIFRSLYEEDGFVCPYSHIPHHLQTLQAFGSGVGAIIGGHMADYYGRKWVTVAGATCMCLFGVVGSFSTTWTMLALTMVGMGVSYGTLVDASMTLASETVGPRYRIVQTLAFQWSLVMQIASLVAYWTAEWRRYLLTINVICAPAILFMLFWRESPRWLIQKRRQAEACRELSAIGRVNGCRTRFCVDDLSEIQLSGEDSGRRIYSMWDLFATKKLAAYSMVMVFSALTVEMCVAVIIFDVQVLAGNPFLNIAFYGMLRIWVPFFIVLMDTRSTWFGRRTLFLFAQSITVLCYSSIILMMLFAPARTTGEERPPHSAFDVLRTVLSLVGGVVNSSIFFTIYKQYSIELYPTLMRAMAVGTFGVVERIGGGLAPQLISMNSWAWQGTAITITTAIALISLVTGYAILPETKNSAMPDVQETEQRKKDKTNALSQVS